MIIQSKRVFYQEKFQPLQVEIEGNTISNILPYNYKKVDFDYNDNKIIPGLIDIHCHGYNGRDVAHPTSEWIKTWRKDFLKEGVTSFCPSSSSAEYDEILEGMRIVADDALNNHEGANVLGIYSEGPYLSNEYSGAQPKEYLKVPTKELVDQIIEASKGLLINVLIAPEILNSDYSIIKYLTDKGIRVSIGHSGASYDICEEAIKAGASSFTHTFNGMPPFKNRTPGPVASAMDHQELYAELIGDGVHVDPISARIFSRIKGKDRLITVTDSNKCKGLPLGEHELFGRKYYVTDENICRTEKGGIAGSCWKVNKVLQREIEFSKFDEVTAINSLTKNPCEMLGIKNKGIIKEGYDADITVLDDNYDVKAVIVNGKKYI